MKHFGKINTLIVGSFAVVFLAFIIVGIAFRLQQTSFVPTRNYAAQNLCHDTVTLVFPTITPTVTVTATVTPSPAPLAACSQCYLQDAANMNNACIVTRLRCSPGTACKPVRKSCVVAGYTTNNDCYDAGCVASP